MTNKKGKKEKRPLLSKLLLIILILALIVIYARYIGTKGLQVLEYNVKSESIPTSFDSFSIVHFSDLEFGSTFDLEDLSNLVNKINSLKPYIVVFTGDILSENYILNDEEKIKLIEKFSEIDPLIGKYSIRGDKDTSSNIYEEIMELSGFKDITNSYELIYYKGLTPIVIYGLDSLIGGNQDLSSTFSYPNEDTEPAYMATYKVLIAHEPDTIDLVSSYNVDLMLAGHSHNNYINIPYLKDLYHIDGAKKYYDLEYEVNGTKLYISPGLGTDKLKMRLFARPSISIYRLYSD